MRNNLLLLISITALFCACSKKDLNLPQPSPMPVPQGLQEESRLCEFEFSPHQSFSEIAIIANEMQERCGYSSAQVLNLARHFTHRSEHTR